MNCYIRSSLRAALVLFCLIGVLCTAPSVVAPVYSHVDRHPSHVVYDHANWIFENAKDSNYEHNHHPVHKQVQILDSNSCLAKTNCSGFVGYVLHNAARTQFDAIRNAQPNRRFPQAKTYAQFFSNLSESVPNQGWIKIASVADLRCGDLIAWQKPGTKGRGNTGHTMFVAKRPGPAQVLDGKRFVSVFVLDCSSVTHFQPEQFPKGVNQSVRDGIGKGFIRLLVDANDVPIGYWEGTYSHERGKPINRPTLTNSVAFARVVASR